MVRTNNILVSTLALGACYVSPVVGFASESPKIRPSTVRLDLTLDGAESSSSSEDIIRKNGPLAAIRIVKDDEVNSVSAASDLPPVLQQITDERRNFQMNLGKAMDTLRKDLPYLLKETPGTSTILVA